MLCWHKIQYSECISSDKQQFEDFFCVAFRSHLPLYSISLFLSFPLLGPFYKAHILNLQGVSV